MIIYKDGIGNREEHLVRYGPEHHDQTHAAILAAAADMLREQGFEGVSVGSVMKAVGLTHGGFYAHFSTRPIFSSPPWRRP